MPTSSPRSRLRSTAESRMPERSLRPLLRDEADPAAGFENREPDIRKCGDLLPARLGEHLADREALALEVLLDRPAVLNQDQRLAAQCRAQSWEAEPRVRGEHSEQRERAEDD